MKKFIVVENYYSIYVVSIRDTIEEAQKDMSTQIQTFSAGCDESKIRKFIGNDRAWAIFDDDTTGEHEKTELYICEMANETMKSAQIKKYTLDNYKDFCKEAFVMPPFEEDEDLDEWFDTHKITINTAGHSIELEYDADTINELEFSLREIDEAINGSGKPTTGNTKDSHLRPAEFKDIIRFYIWNQYENHRGEDYRNYIHKAADNLCYMGQFSATYKTILENVYHYNDTFKCDFSRFDPATICEVTPEKIVKMALDWIGSEIETSYDASTDKTFIIDYTFCESGDFIGWYWGSTNDTDTKYYIDVYKSHILN